MSDRLNSYVKRFGILLVMIALIAGTQGCIFGPSSQTLEIRTWYDLDAIRNDSSGDYVLMNDLDSTTDGYDELAGPAANDGKGWHPLHGPGLEENNPPFNGKLLDQAGNITKRTDQRSIDTVYRYDDLGRLTSFDQAITNLLGYRNSFTHA